MAELDALAKLGLSYIDCLGGTYTLKPAEA